MPTNFDLIRKKNNIPVKAWKETDALEETDASQETNGSAGQKQHSGLPKTSGGKIDWDLLRKKNGVRVKDETPSLLERSSAAGVLPDFTQMRADTGNGAQASGAVSGTMDKTPLERFREEIGQNSSLDAFSFTKPAASFQSVYTPEEAGKALDSLAEADKLYNSLRRDTTEGGAYVRSSEKYQPTDEQRSQIEEAVAGLQARILDSDTASAIERELAGQYIGLFQKITEKGDYAKLALSQFAQGMLSPVQNTAAGISNMIGDIASGGRLSEATKVLDDYFAEHPKTLQEIAQGKPVYTPAIAEETGVRQGDLEQYLKSAKDRAMQAYNYETYAQNLNQGRAEFIGSNAYSLGAQIPGLLLTSGANSVSPMWKKTAEEAKKLGYLTDPKTGNVIKNVKDVTGGLLGNLADGKSLKTALKSAFQGNFATYFIGVSAAGGQYNELMRTEDYDVRNFLNAFGQGFAEYFTEGLFGFSDMASFERFFDSSIGSGTTRFWKGLLNWLSGGGEEALEEVVNAPLGELVNLATGKKSDMVQELTSWNPAFQTGGFRGAKAILGEDGIFNLSDMVRGGLSGFVTGAVLGMAGSVASTYDAMREGADISKTVKTLNRFVKEELPDVFRPQMLDPNTASRKDVAAYTVQIQNAIADYAGELKSQMEAAGTEEGVLLPTAAQGENTLPAAGDAVQQGENAQAAGTTTAIDADPATHTPEQMKTIRAYINGADGKLRGFFERYIKNPAERFARYTISRVSARQADDVSRLLGGDYSGYQNAIDRNGVLHILKRHGENGTADHSMANLDDASRIGYILDNYDTVERTLTQNGEPDFTSGYRARDNTYAPLLTFSKKINGSYYVIEAVPDSSYQKMWVISAYIGNKNGGGYASATDAEAPSRTSETSLPSPASIGGGGYASAIDAAAATPSLTPEAPLPSPASIGGGGYASADAEAPSRTSETSLPSPISNTTISQPDTGVNSSIRENAEPDTSGGIMLPTASEPDAQFSIETIDGRMMPVIDTKNDTRNFDAAESYLKALVNTERPFATILRDAQPVYIGRDLPGEYRSSEYTKGMNKALRTAKMQAVTNLDEMLLLAENGEWRGNVKTKHRRDAANGWYRYNTEFAIPSHDRSGNITGYKVYGGTLLIRNDADGKSYLYDLIDIKEKKKASSSAASAGQIRTAVFEPGPSSNTTISQPDTGVNSSIRESGEPDTSGGIMLPTAEQAEETERLRRAATELERSGIEAGASEEDIQIARRLSNVLGREIRFYDGNTREGTEAVANGYYDRNTIYVNSRSRNPVAQIISHELTHSLEAAKAYGKFSKMILRELESTGEDLNILRAEKKNLYARNGVMLSNENANREIVAEYVEKNLLSNEKKILEFTRQNRTLAQRISGWIQSTIAKLGNKKSQERVFLERAYRLYAKALRQTQNETGRRIPQEAQSAMQNRTQESTAAQPTGVRKYQEPPRDAEPPVRRTEEPERYETRNVERAQSVNPEGMRELQEAYAAGQITDEEFDEAINALMEEEGLLDRDMLEAQYSISENFAYEIDAWDSEGRLDGEVFILGTTGDVLQGLGAIEQDIYLRSEKINNILEKHPEMTLTEIKRIPEILDDPILVLKSRNAGRGRRQNTRLVLFGTVRAENGQPVLTVMDLRPVENGLAINDMQKITSSYVKDHDPVWYVQNSDILHADKKRTIPLLRTIGFQMPIELQQSGSMGSISYQQQNVNLQGVPFHEVVMQHEDIPGRHEPDTSGGIMLPTAEDRQYSISESGTDDTYIDDSTYRNAMRTNDTALQQRLVQAAAEYAMPGSRVRDKNGNLMPVYHGTKSFGFTVFDRSKTDYEGPFYFTSDTDAAASYSGVSGIRQTGYPGNTEGGEEAGNYAVYLNLQNPLIVDCRGSDWDAIPVPRHLMQEYLRTFPTRHRVRTLDSPDLAEYAEQAGYDGVILRNIVDSGGELGYNEISDVYVAFSPEQIKSADAVTYDDNGQPIPLAERFRMDDDDIRYSISEDFAEEIDAWDGRSRETFQVGTVSDVLKSIGVRDGRIVWHSGKIAQILRKHSAMDRNTIKQVPQILEDPIVVLKSKNADSRMVMFGEITDNAGKPVTAVLELMPTSRDGRVLDLNVIASAYGKDHIKNFIESSDLLYLDPNKNRTDTWLQSVGLQLPSDTTTYGSIGTITYHDGEVKISGVPYDQYMQEETIEYKPENLPTVNDDDIRYSISEDFAEEIDAWDGEQGRTFVIGTTSDALQSIGVEPRKIIWRGDKILRILNKHKEMTKETIKQVPQILEYPIVILKSKNMGSRIVVFGEIEDTKGNPVTAILEINPTSRGGELLQLNIVASAYGKNNAKSFIESSDLLYLDPNKNRTDMWLQGLGLQLPSNTTTYGPIGTITYHDGEVKISGVPYDQYMQENGEVYTRQYSMDENAENERETGYDDRGERWDGTMMEIGKDQSERETEEARRIQNAEYQNYPWLYGTGETVSEAIQGMEDRERTQTPGMLPKAEADTVENLPAKAKNYFTRAERYLNDKVASVLNVPNLAGRESFQTAVREIADEYLQNGTVSEETIARVFNQAYEGSIALNRAYYEEYRELRAYLETLELTITREQANGIANQEAFLQSNRNRIGIRIGEDGNVNEVYAELQRRWPALFQRGSALTEAEKVQKIASVAQSFEVAKRSLDGYAGENANEYRRLAKHDFEAAVQDATGEFQVVRRYMEDRNAKEHTIQIPTTQEEVAKLWVQVKDARRKYERTLARNLLTEHDEIQVGRLLRGEIEPQHLDPKRDNVRGITAVYRAKREYEDLAKVIRAWNQARKAALKQQADGYLQTANDWHDKPAGILYARETMERNIRDIVPDEDLAENLIHTYFTPVHEAAAEANRMKNRYRNRVRKLELSRKADDGNLVSEAHAVQLLGEAEDNIRMLEKSRGLIRERDGKTLEEWRGAVKKLWEENPNLDAGKIRSAVEEFRKIYDGLFQMMNEARIRNGYEPVNYRSGYFPHFQPGNGDGILARFGKAMGVTTEVSALPTTINGLTHTFRPGIQWFGNAQERLGFNTVYDAVEGFDKYIEGVSDVIFQTDNIQRLRALATQIRYRTGDEGVRKQIDGVLTNPNLTEEEKQERTGRIYESGRYALSNFVTELDEYTNLLANKKSRADRNMEQALGRNVYNLMKALESRMAANMVAINPGSWLTNFIPLVQGNAMLDRGMLLRGMWDTLKAYRSDDGIVNQSSFLTNRRGSDPIVKTYEQGERAAGGAKKAGQTIEKTIGKSGEILASPMEFIDYFVADSLVRARYRQNLGKGMSEEAAMQEADAFAASVMAGRSKGAMPTLFYSRNPIVKLFTQFQLEVNNQISYILKDIPREKRKNAGRSITAMLLKFFLGSWLFNEIFEFTVGRRPALDPIGILNDTAGDLTGWELPNLVELGLGAASGNLPSFQAEQAGLYEAGINLVESLAEQTPFIGGLLGGGRLPVSSAIPNVGNLWNAATNEDWSTEKRLQEVRDELIEKPVAYLALPFGGGQLKKIYEGIEGILEGGSYVVNAEGERQLQYPIYTDTTGETIGNAIRATLFGRTSLPTGREWIEGGFGMLSAKQTAVYEGMLEAGISGREAYELIESMRQAEKTDTERKADQQRRILEESEISGEGKSIAYYGMLASDRERELMTSLDDDFTDMGEVTNVLLAIKDAGNLKGAAASNAKRDAILESGLSEGDKKEIYRYTFGERRENGTYTSSRDEDIRAFENAGLSFDEFLEAQNEYSTINEQYDRAGDKALEFSRWVDGQPYTDKQKDVIKTLRFWSQVAGNADRYEKFVDAGLSTDDAYALASTLAMLEPEEGKEQVSSYQRYTAILESSLGKQEKLDAIGAVMGTEMETESGNPTQYARLLTAMDAGVELQDWFDVTRYKSEAKTDYDEYGEEVKSAKEKVVEYIDSLNISEEEKDALYLYGCNYAESGLSDTPWQSGGWSMSDIDWSGIIPPMA